MQNEKARQDAEKAGKKYKPEKLPAKPTSFGRTKTELVNDSDWCLDSPEVKEDYRKMKSPPLALFSYVLFFFLRSLPRLIFPCASPYPQVRSYRRRRVLLHEGLFPRWGPLPSWSLPLDPFRHSPS